MKAKIEFIKRHRLIFEIALLFLLLGGFFSFLLVNQTYFFYYLSSRLIYYFLLVFVFIFAYLFFTVINKNKYYYLRAVLIWFAVIYFICVMMISHILIRHNTGDDFYVHDSVVLTEAATKFLSEGRNFYQENYYDTPYAIYKGIFYDVNGPRHDNPAMTQYPYLPFIPVFSLPLYHLFSNLFGFFDERFVHLLLFLILLPILWQLPKKKENKILFFYTFCFNPFFLIFFVAGYNDIFVFFWLILCLYFLRRKIFLPSAVALALACAAKQSAWLILPFYFFYIYYHQDNSQSVSQKFFGVIKKIWPFLVVFLIIFAPFALWGLNDLIDDIYRKEAGTASLSYPISGLGLSFILLKLKLVKTAWDYFPFWIFQIFLGLPGLLILIKVQKRINTVWYIFFAYGLFLFVFWYFSRYFHDSHFGFLTMILISAFFLFDQASRDNILNN